MSDLIYRSDEGPSPNTPLQRTRAGSAGSADSSAFGGRHSLLNGSLLGGSRTQNSASGQSGQWRDAT
jgi:hypothetical protein